MRIHELNSNSVPTFFSMQFRFPTLEQRKIEFSDALEVKKNIGKTIHI